MIDEKKKMTAQGLSVGADDGQSISKNSENSIPTSGQKSNDEIVNSQDSLEEMYRKIQRMTDPRYLHTLTMTELFQTTYKSRPPVVEGLLYAGAYILAGAPKIGKSFLVAQIAYHVSTGQDLWGYKVHQGTVLYLALEDDFQRIQSRMFMMYGVNDTPNLHFATAAGNALDPEIWDNGTLMQREAYLKSLRAQDPAKAREQFEKGAASFDARERAAFAGCLGEGLSAADEAFLETLLEKDRSREVRQAAASLLVRLPESGYVRRMGERLAACIVVPEAKGGLIGRIASAFSAPLPAIEPPESFDPEWKKDLLEEKKPQYEEFGQRAWWLYQIGRCVPLAWWEAHTGLPPEALIGWAQKTDWRNVLLRIWLDAALRERHAAWASALLAHVFKEQIEISVGKGHFNASAFIGLLPPPEREAALLERFPCPGSEGGGAKFAQQHYKQMMQFGRFAASEWEGDATFSLEGGRALIRRIRFWANHSEGLSQKSYETSFALTHIIKATFWLIPVSLLDDLLEDWPLCENGAPFCQSRYEFLATAIRTRKALHQYFA